MTDKSIFDNDFNTKWCPGCGNFGILRAMKDAFAAQSLTPDKVLLVSGIGQAGKTPHFLKCNMFHGLHGRALPLATGAKIANHHRPVIVNSGDGDCYGEGGNHFMHAIRRNIDITLLVHNNNIYGLTKGQASPTTEFGTKTRIQPNGVISNAFQPLTVALSLGAGFVARGFSGDTNHLSRLIQQAIEYKGFSIIDILQPCVSFNPINTNRWYKKRVYSLEDEDYRTDRWQLAIERSREWGDRIPIGIFYSQKKEVYTDYIGILEKDTLISKIFAYNPEKLQKTLDTL